MCQVRNSMEMTLGQSFRFLEVQNKSELLQKYMCIHTMQMNLRFIVTLLERYIYLWLSALKQSCVNEKQIIVKLWKIAIAQVYCRLTLIIQNKQNKFKCLSEEAHTVILLSSTRKNWNTNVLIKSVELSQHQFFSEPTIIIAAVTVSQTSKVSKVLSLGRIGH